jgi:soluble lytic murein transglycosylase-like protein
MSSPRIGRRQEEWKTIFSTDRRAKLYLAIALVVSLVVLATAWSEIWNRGAKIAGLEAELEAKKGDVRVLEGELSDLRSSPEAYLLLYKRASLARLEKIEPRWNEIVSETWEAARKHGVPPEIVIAIIEHESRFNPEAIGSAGEFGLMQIYPAAWPQFDTSRGFEIAYNIDFGCRVFSGCLKEAKGDIREALRLYNGRGELPEGMIPYPDRVLNGRTIRRKF